VDKEVAEKTKVFSDLTKTILMLGSAGAAIAMWVGATFATNFRVDSVEERTAKVEKAIENQQKISCLTAVEVGVKKDSVKEICQLDIK
jgi:hypothetical protein